jgi:hypothetical protein
MCVHDTGRENDTRKRYILYTLFWTLIGDLFPLSKHFPLPIHQKKDKLPWASATSYVKQHTVSVFFNTVTYRCFLQRSKPATLML